MVKTEFMKLYEELTNINDESLQEDATSDHTASKNFWAAAKSGKIDEASFHAAFDAELTELGLMDVFNPDGYFTGRNVYGRIKTAKEANPDSWALKALSKLWALRYVDNVRFESEIAAQKAAAEEEEKRRAEEIAEKERLEQERIANLTQEYKDLLPEALKLVDKELLDEYKATYEITEADIDIEVIVQKNYHGRNKDYVRAVPCRSGYIFGIDSRKDKLSNLVVILNGEFKKGIETAKKEVTRKKRATNAVIDVFKHYQGYHNASCSAVLLGESGTLYYIGLKCPEGSTGIEVEGVGDIPEKYKVIYTCVYFPSTNDRATMDSISNFYYSWDSSEASKIKALIPEIGKGSAIWQYWETTKLSDGSWDQCSTMDNIDSWARKKHTYLATD